MKKFLKRWGNKIAAVGTAVVTCVVGAITALADDNVDATVLNSINSGISSGATNIKSMIATNAPILFGLAVLSVAVSIGLAWIHKLRKAS